MRLRLFGRGKKEGTMLHFAGDDLLLQRMRDELIENGFEELRTPDEVDRAFADAPASMLLMINSVCGCAAGTARPGVVGSLNHEPRPEKLVTVFAGQDREATERAREYCPGYPPSSPCAVLFRDGEVAHLVPRHEIEGRTADQVAALLTTAYDRHLS